MDCRDTAERIADYMFGLLAEDERAAVEAHLASGCIDCRREFRELTEAAAAVADTVDPVAPPAELRGALLRAIAEPVTVAREPERRGRRRAGWGLYLAASMAAIVAGGTGGWLWRLESSGVAAADVWRRQIASAEESLGNADAKLLAAANVAAEPDVATHLLYDRVSGQLHVQIASPRLPEGGAEAWVAIVDDNGGVVAAERLRRLDEQHASTVLNLEEGAVVDVELVVTRSRPGATHRASDADILRIEVHPAK
jgi:hypothetical protein